MKYAKILGHDKQKIWFNLKTSIGKNENIVDDAIRSFEIFIRKFDDLQLEELKIISGFTLDRNDAFTIDHSKKVEMVLLKIFIDGVGLDLIREAKPQAGSSDIDAYLYLLKQILEKDNYPYDIYAYSEYRSRGTPVTWVDITNDFSSARVEKLLTSNTAKITRMLSTKLKYSRTFHRKETVNNLDIYLLSKPTSTKMIQAEDGNVEVSGASYSMIIHDKSRNRIGMRTGSKQEISEFLTYIRRKLFGNALAPPRSDIKVNGGDLLRKLTQPEEDDFLITHSIELKQSGLPENPAIKLKGHAKESIDETIDLLSDSVFRDTSISDLKQIDFWMPTDRVDFHKKMGLYTFGDDWQRTVLNTTNNRATSLIESQFLDTLAERLGGIDIKKSRLILKELQSEFIINKLIKDKKINTIPPIPVEVEKIIVELTDKKFIKKQKTNVQRKCWNSSCYRVSWDQWDCPNCGQSDMRIVSTAVRISILENRIQKALSEDPQLLQIGAVSLHTRKRRNKYQKSVIGVFDKDKKVTTFLLIASNKKDLHYSDMLIKEGFGVVAILDPRLITRKGDLEGSGCEVVELADVLAYMLGKRSLNPIVAAIIKQQNRMLERIYSNAQNSISSIRRKTSYNENDFEIDIKNLIHAMVPDVVRLGTEYSGTSVPDGYSKYGVNGRRGKGSRKKLFGWDAKYTTGSSYRLQSKDVDKQRGYIRWLDNSLNEPSKFGRTKCYAIISNFEDPRNLIGAVEKIATGRYVMRNSIKIVLIEDLLLAKICEWLLEHWSVSQERSAEIADEIFKWFSRNKSTTYTISKFSDWKYIKRRLEKFT